MQVVNSQPITAHLQRLIGKIQVLKFRNERKFMMVVMMMIMTMLIMVLRMRVNDYGFKKVATKLNIDFDRNENEDNGHHGGILKMEQWWFEILEH